MITRKEYMATVPPGTNPLDPVWRKASMAHHRAYYAQFVSKHTIRSVVNFIGEDKLRASTDDHLNDIPMALWDSATIQLPMACTFKSRGDYLTNAGAVCVAKEAARQWLESLQ